MTAPGNAAGLLQLGRDFPGIVDLAVVDQDIAAAVAGHGLIASLREVDHRQAPLAEGQAAIRIDPAIAAVGHRDERGWRSCLRWFLQADCCACRSVSKSRRYHTSGLSAPVGYTADHDSDSLQEPDMDRPFVTVVITAFNRADTIGRAVASVQAQSYDNWEILVVDDASTDNIAAVVAALAEPRLRMVRNETNRGIGGAKNVGIAHGKGSHIAFLDSDDEWLPDKLTRQLAIMAAEPGDSAELYRLLGGARTWKRSIAAPSVQGKLA